MLSRDMTVFFAWLFINILELFCKSQGHKLKRIKSGLLTVKEDFELSLKCGSTSTTDEELSSC